MTSTLRGLAVITLTLFVSGCADSTGPLPQSDAGLRLAVTGPVSISAEEEAALGDAFDLVDEYAVTITDAVTLEVLADTVIAITAGASVHALDVRIPEAAFGRVVSIALVASADGRELYRSVTTVTLEDQLAPLPVELEIRYTGPGIRGTVTDDLDAPLGGVVVGLYATDALIRETTTEDDGTYLFVDVPPGSYQVQPTSSQEVVDVCPGSRAVNLATSDVVVIANFRISTGTCSTSVLVLSGGDFNDTPAVETLLSVSQNLRISTFFHVNQLPSADELARHDVVLLFMNGLFDESAALGGRLAEYVDRGGNLVLGAFYWQGRSDSGLGSVGWGALEQMDPFTSLGGARYEPGSLDLGSLVTQHPLTDRLTSLTTTSYWGGVSEIQGVTQVVARWLDGTPLMGYRMLPGGQRVVGVTLFPAAGGIVTGDVAELWENAVWWAATGSGPN